MKSLLYLIHRFLLKRPFLVATENRFRCKFRFKTPDCIGRTIYRKGDYEPVLTKYILEQLNFAKGDIFLDVGANIGWYAILLAKNLKRTSRSLPLNPTILILPFWWII